MVRKIVIHTFVALGYSFVLAFCWICLLTGFANRVIHSWEQPQEIEYMRNSKYTLFVREKAPDWSFLLHRRARHEIFIGRDDSYGHWFDCTFHGGWGDDTKTDEYIRRSAVEWTEEGVSIKQESGHVVFFPKKTFVGGR